MDRNELIQEILAKHIGLSQRLRRGERIRGVYGFFSNKDGERLCLYIGRADDILKRIHGHLTKRKAVLSSLIKKKQEAGYRISVRVLAEVKFEGTNYYRDLHRLAYAEYKNIEKYQKKGQCLDQKPEGSWITLKNWEKDYEKKS